MNIFYNLFKVTYHSGDVVDLREKYRTNKITAYDGVPTIYYDVLRHSDKQKVGTTDLRLTVEGDMYYYGHIGYNIIESQRGHGYAYESSKLLFKIARKEFGLKELIITCSPENIASYKTLVKLGGELIETVDVPKDHTLYKFGENKKCIFKYKI